MPKVTDEYLADKKNLILEFTGEILKEKPLYLITMRDIIKRAGFSQGAIYRYYANVDEIYVDFINRNTTDTLLEKKIDDLLTSAQSEKAILMQCIIAIGEYIGELLNSVGGKLFFELLVSYAYHTEKRNSIFPKLNFKQSIEYAQNKILEYVLKNIHKGVFHPTIPVDSIVMFTCVAIDGISQGVAIGSIGDNNQDAKIDVNVPEMFQTLAKSIINFLEE